MRPLYPYSKQIITQDDIHAVVSVLKSQYLTQGPVISQFEQAICKYTGAKFAVAVSNGTAGLHLACMAAGIKRGDEGITSPMTFVASANCITYCGGTVRFADIDESTGLINPMEIKKQMSKNTRVIIPVHYAGQSCDMEKIHLLVKGKNIMIIEDAAHAIGSEYKGTKVGSCKYSDMTVFSFHPVKTITTGEGGVVTTNDKGLYEKLLLLRTHGITKNSNMFKNISHKNEQWYYEMQSLGYNYRMTDIQAALGISQMRQLEYFKKRRSEIVILYDQMFSNVLGIKPSASVKYGTSCRHLYVIQIDFAMFHKSRQDIMNALTQKRIGTQVHYIPVHHQPYYAKLTAYKKGDFPHTESFYKQCLSIPLYPSLKEKDVRYISNSIKNSI